MAAGVDYDVAIIGAGISGINFAYRLQERNPDLTYCIIEGRHEIGGTWSLFNYPGIRSDSDLYTFGFPWRPWVEKETIAHGSVIKSYLKESAAVEGIDKHIKFNHHVNKLNWSNKDKSWTFDLTKDGTESKTLTSRFVFFGTGYYNYDEPLKADIPGIKDFKGTVIHPQFWPEDLDYTDKRVAIIGSGATAITLLPVVAEKAAHVTMLQRSPSYVLSVPGVGLMEKILRWVLPAMIAHRIIRFRWTLLSFILVTLCQRFPNVSRRIILLQSKLQLPKDVPLDPNFIPNYNPWQQRMCLCPDGDFYKGLNTGKCSVVTGTIAKVGPKSIRLNDGQEVHPDIIVTATGLKLQVLGGINVSVDNKAYVIPDHYAWKGCMLEGLPNAALAFGYVDASWTLGADATSQLVTRILKQMSKEKVKVIMPKRSEEEIQNMKESPFMKLNSTYVNKGKAILPKTGNRPQWEPRSYYWKDIMTAWYGDIKTDMLWT